MDNHDQPLGETRPGHAETEKLLRGIGLAAVPKDRDDLIWACGYEAGRASVGRVAPTARRTIRSWLPLVTSTAAAFLVGYFTSGAASLAPTGRNAPPVAASAPRIPADARAKPDHPAPATAPAPRPREGLFASVPPDRLDSILAAPREFRDPGDVARPFDEPPLRTGSYREALDRFNL
jgi:hypothetical protein